MSRLRIPVAFVSLLFLCRIASAQSTTLNLFVFLPPPPVTDSEPIQINAVTTDYIFPDTGHDIFSTFSINGSTIDWEISSYDDRSGVQAPVELRMGTALNLNPLAPGIYHLQASWQNYAIFILPGAPTSGTGTLDFTVVPEPSTLALLTLGAVGLLAVRRR